MHHPDRCCLFIGKADSAPAGFVSLFDPAETSPARWVRSALKERADRSVDHIACHFFIEHLGQTDILVLLRECRRLLRPGGTLEIRTVDLAVIGARYAAGEWPAAGVAKLGAQWITGGAEYLNTMLRNWERRWLCDAGELARLADLAGLQGGERLAVEADETLPLPADEVLAMRFTKRQAQFEPQPLVSIVVPAFRPDYLVECLDSALAQTYRPLEIVIVDDSLDAEVERICRDYAEREPCVRYTRNATRLGEARNLTQGIRLARGEFIKPLYDDDLLLPDCVARLVAAYTTTPDAWLAIGRRELIGEAGEALDSTLLGPPLAPADCIFFGPEVIAEIAESGINRLGEPTVMLFRRADVLALGEPDVMSLFRRRFMGIGDIGLAVHLLSRGDLAYVAEPIGRFRIHPGQNQRRADFRKWVTPTWAYFREQAARLGLDKAALRPLPEGAGVAKGEPPEPMPGPDDESYHRWMKARALDDADGVLMADLMALHWQVRPHIQLLVRCRADQGKLLADTLDSLNFQFYRNHRVEVFAPFEAPGALLEAVPELRWHVVADPAEAAPAMDAAVRAGGCDWIVELPPGAVLDPLYLFRIVHQINLDLGGPAIHAYYTDDDELDGRQIRRRPRFKPEFDAETLLGTDLLGPLVLGTDAWFACGGASTQVVRPWYDQALRLVDALGEAACRHIAEPLLSLPAALADEDHAAECAAAVRRHLARRGIGGRVTVTSPTTWSVRYRGSAQPAVTIAIPGADKPEYLEQCVASIVDVTAYGDYEILIVAAHGDDADVPAAVARLFARREATVRVLAVDGPLNPARFANLAAEAAHGDYLLLLADDVRVTRPDWLHLLVAHALRPQVAGVGAMLVTADGSIEHAGYVPGLGGSADSPHRGHCRQGDAGYLDSLRVIRTVAAVSSACLLVKRSDFIAAGGMDETAFSAAHADVDFCLRVHRDTGRRWVLTADLALTRLGGSVLEPVALSPLERVEAESARLRARENLLGRWFDTLAAPAFWSPHLTRHGVDARIDTCLVPDWRALPTPARKIMAFPVRNVQGAIRITQPLRALKRSGQVRSCVFSPSEDAGLPPVLDVARHGADVIIAHQLIGPASLEALRQWRRHLRGTFLVYSVDDLLTQMPASSSLRLGVPADARSYLAQALKYCDRLVVSTDYLADAYGHLARDVRVVPNRLERAVWTGLQSRRRTGPRLRVGWAGGTAHAGDLQLIAGLVAATANEVDWIFMGMCPDEILPFVKEFHPFGAYDDYPARLAALNLDLAVAPLEQIPFNRGKSNLRLLEYGVLGIPVLCTDIEPYRGTPACALANRPQDWLEALRARIHDPDALAPEGDRMRQWVLDNFILEDHLDTWLHAHLPG